jgi:hypothetical protein
VVQDFRRGGADTRAKRSREPNQDDKKKRSPEHPNFSSAE